MSGVKLKITAQKEGSPESICTIKCGRLDFMSDMLIWAAKWGKENGYHMRMGNTPDGMYELLGFEPEAEEEAHS